MITEYHPEDSLKSILKHARKCNKNFSEAERRKITSAFEYGKKAHEGEFREGDLTAYFSHPLAVAENLSGIGANTDLICAALLHDTIENAGKGYLEIRKKFGNRVAKIVGLVTKPKLVGMKWVFANEPEYSRNDEAKGAHKEYVEYLHLENIMKSESMDAVLLKLYDRLHNFQTMTYVEPKKQKSIIRKFMNVYRIPAVLDPVLEGHFAEEMKKAGIGIKKEGGKMPKGVVVLPGPEASIGEILEKLPHAKADAIKMRDLGNGRVFAAVPKAYSKTKVAEILKSNFGEKALKEHEGFLPIKMQPNHYFEIDLQKAGCSFEGAEARMWKSYAEMKGKQRILPRLIAKAGRGIARVSNAWKRNGFRKER